MKTQIPTNGPEIKDGPPRPIGARWQIRLFAIMSITAAVAIVWFSNLWLTDRFTERTRQAAELRVALYSNAIYSELQRNRVVPLLLSRDPVMVSALNSDDFSATSQRLISFSDEIGAESLRLLDEEGRTVASSDRTQIGQTHRSANFFVSALRTDDTVFSVTELETGAFQFTYARRIESEKQGIGVIVVDVNLRQFEQRWRSPTDAVLISDSQGRVVIATDPRWRGRTVADALSNRGSQTAFQRALDVTSEYFDLRRTPDAYLEGEAVMEMSTRIPFRGWQLVSFSTYASVRERVNGVLALEIMGFAIILALTFYMISRRAQSAAGFFRRESEQLRDLNQRLSREIAERKKVQETLAVAEQSLAQSQKLAALGEMSAAVSHELNQPLAAMKTYLAGAALLLKRDRPEEAQASFQRIDDLIERMGAITKQMKSYARKGGDTLIEVDLRDAVSGSLEMLEPQLKRGNIKLSVTLPEEPVRVIADRVRLEQVIINLFRNAVDATKSTPEPEIELMVHTGETATLSVRDNGPGIENLDELFEPFYTTKQPGEGVGLGLAISSSIVNDLGGNLTARNSQSGGAVFEMQLPMFNFARLTGENPIKATG